MIRGTTHDQDSRFCDKTKKMLEKSQWPDKYDIKIDLTKIDLELIKVWIQKRLLKLLGEEDDIISGTILSLIDQSAQKQQKLNAKLLHVAISGFLQDKTLTFVSQLWDILDEAQRSSRGIPECLLQQKKKSQELHRRKLQQLNAKRYKLNHNKFNQNIKNQPKTYRNESQQKGRKQKRERSRQHQHKKKKYRQRHRSRSHHRDRRSRQHSAEKRHKKHQKQSKQKHKQSHSSERSKTRRKVHRQSSEPSDSSGVISSSS